MCGGMITKLAFHLTNDNSTYHSKQGVAFDKTHCEPFDSVKTNQWFCAFTLWFTGMVIEARDSVRRNVEFIFTSYILKKYVIKLLFLYNTNKY